MGLGGGAGREWAEPHPLARRRQGRRLLAGRTADPSPPAAGCFHRNPAGRRGRGGSSGGGGTFPHPGQRQRGAPPTARSGQLAARGAGGRAAGRAPGRGRRRRGSGVGSARGPGGSAHGPGGSARAGVGGLGRAGWAQRPEGCRARTACPGSCRPTRPDGLPGHCPQITFLEAPS